MSRRPYPHRYASYAHRVLGGVLAAAGVAGVVTLGTLIESDVGNDPRGQRAALNEFYEVLAGDEVLHTSGASNLAVDLRALYEETPQGRDDARKVVEGFDYAQDSEDFTNRYQGASGVVGTGLFSYSGDSGCTECGRLEPSAGDDVVQALKGNLSGLVKDPAEVALDRSWWAPAWVYVALALLGSTVGWLVGRRHEEGSWQSPLGFQDWALDGNATTEKLANALLAPHLSGVALVVATTTGVARERRRARAAGAARRAAAPGASTEEDADLAQARAALDHLEKLVPRTPAVEAATEEVRGLVARLASAGQGLAAVEAEAQAEAILTSVRGLEDARSTALAAREEVARLKAQD